MSRQILEKNLKKAPTPILQNPPDKLENTRELQNINENIGSNANVDVEHTYAKQAGLQCKWSP